MAKKTLAQLKKELSLAERKNKILEAKRIKAIQIEAETRKIQSRLKELNRSAFSKSLQKLKRKKLTKEEAIRMGQKGKSAAIKSYKVGKQIWDGFGKVITHLDKMNDPVRVPIKKKKGRKN